MNILLVYGGKSAEHDVSIISAYNIMKEIYYKFYTVTPIYITRDGQWIKGKEITAADQLTEESDLRIEGSGEALELSDLKQEDAIIFPVLHGPNGEDGTVQGLFEVLEMPYVGAGVLASSTGMDKIISKALFEKAGIPQLPYMPVSITDWKVEPEQVLTDIEEILSYPIFVKPANLGSSVGITEAKDKDGLQQAIDLAFEYDHRVVVEQGVQAREIELAVLGNEDVHTSIPGELVKDRQFYDYAAKYETKEVELQIPAALSESVTKKLRAYATRAFLAIDGSGLTRADFFVTDDEEIYINEVNTFPGFTTISMYPKLWEKTGLSYGDLIEELIQLGVKRFESRKNHYLKDR